ncbi:MAG TPA: LemA family protein [Chitinophagaceae bacterium]|nr:LemA family protein [Chitinophagaceae bacterium]
MKIKQLVIPGVILALLILYVSTTYNSIVKKEEKMKQDWSEVQNTYQRRLDLIPNLVSIVKGVSDFESNVLQQIAETRSKAAGIFSEKEIDAGNYVRQKQIQDSLATITNRLILVMENYPDLKGTKAYAALQTQLEGTERRIKVARKDFNESVFHYNQLVKKFPSTLVARLFGFRPKQGFESDTGAEKSVEIKFN